MCGRFVSTTPPDELAKYFDVEQVAEQVAEQVVEPSYNVAPTTDIFVVVHTGGLRRLDAFHWGLVPFWAKDLSAGNKMINARAENLAEKNAYKRAFQKRRCIIPADGFYEWKKLPGQKAKQPVYIQRVDGEPLALAGLWELWRPSDRKVRNIRALTETQSSLLGGENTPLHEGTSSTGFDEIAPRRHEMVTPNPMATPLRQAGEPGQFPGATPLRTPRDNLTLNERGERQLVPQTPRDMRLAESTLRQSLAKLSSLPKPKQSEWELEVLPSEQEEVSTDPTITQEDQDEIDRRERETQEAAAAAEFKRQTQVYQRALPRPAARLQHIGGRCYVHN